MFLNLECAYAHKRFYIEQFLELGMCFTTTLGLFHSTAKFAHVS